MSIRKSCEHIVETHGEQLAVAVAKWARNKRARSELLALVCSKLVKACHSSDLGMYRGVDETNANKSYYSQRPPPASEQMGPVFTMVAETMSDTLRGTDEDVIAYFQFGDAQHDIIGPRFERLALLLWSIGNRRGTLKFAKIRADRNDLPPPEGLHITESCVMVYPSKRKTENSL